MSQIGKSNEGYRQAFLQMSYLGSGLLSLEMQHIIFNSCQLRVPHQTGSSLIISGTFCLSVHTTKTVWIEARNFLMMHFRRFCSFGSFPKCKDAIRAAALRNLLSSRRLQGRVQACKRVPVMRFLR